MVALRDNIENLRHDSRTTINEKATEMRTRNEKKKIKLAHPNSFVNEQKEIKKKINKRNKMTDYPDQIMNNSFVKELYTYIFRPPYFCFF